MRSHSLGGSSSSPTSSSDAADEFDDHQNHRNKYWKERHVSNAEIERVIEDFIANSISEMNNGNSYNHHFPMSIPISCSSHSIHSSTQSRMNSLNANRDLLSPGSDVIVTRTVSPSFYSHGMPQRDTVFRKDDHVRILGLTSDPAWYRARNAHQEEGLVHADCVIRTPNSSSQSFENGIVRMRAGGCDPSAASTASSTSSHHSAASHHQPWFHSMINRENTEKLVCTTNATPMVFATDSSRRSSANRQHSRQTAPPRTAPQTTLKIARRRSEKPIW
uniref:SH3 domain-containing protein n=1 Tax=Caenorhabditis japonica TaxID=281687 RepID=A0A8R1HVE8_CAEJA